MSVNEVAPSPAESLGPRVSGSNLANPSHVGCVPVSGTSFHPVTPEHLQAPVWPLWGHSCLHATRAAETPHKTIPAPTATSSHRVYPWSGSSPPAVHLRTTPRRARTLSLTLLLPSLRRGSGSPEGQWASTAHWPNPAYCQFLCSPPGAELKQRIAF